jgi:hypothetical protein
VTSTPRSATTHPAQRRLSSAAAAGRWLRRPDFVARHGTVDGCSVSDGVRAAGMVDADAERRIWNVADPHISFATHRPVMFYGVTLSAPELPVFIYVRHRKTKNLDVNSLVLCRIFAVAERFKFEVYVSG